MEKQSLINHLGLEKHIEGGYFARTYGPESYKNKSGSDHQCMSSIYYLLTDDSPTGFLHKNKSDIMHYYHFGASVKYILISPEGDMEEHILGHDLTVGERLQLLVPGGWWKSSQLIKNDNYNYGLISEAVSPAFVYDDMVLASEKVLIEQYGQDFSVPKSLLKN